MITTIVIDCDDQRELLLHLTVIREQIRKAFKKDPEFAGKLEDDNCYGSHTVEIKD